MKKQVLNRLRSIEGHVRGIERMVVEEPYCTIGIKRVSVVQSGTHGRSITSSSGGLARVTRCGSKGSGNINSEVRPWIQERS